MDSARLALRVRMALFGAFALAFASGIAGAGPVRFLPQPLQGNHDPLNTLAPVALEPGAHFNRIVDLRLEHTLVTTFFAYDPSWDLLDRIDTPYTCDYSPFLVTNGIFTS